MPLIKSASKQAFKKNVETEMEANPGKSKRAQNLAIAYAMQKKAKAKKMAEGGPVPKKEGPRSTAMYSPDDEDYQNDSAPAYGTKGNPRFAGDNGPNSILTNSDDEKAAGYAKGGMIEDEEKESGYADHRVNHLKMKAKAILEDDMGYNQKMAQGGELEGRDEGMYFEMDMPDDMDESHQGDSEHDETHGEMVDRIMRKKYSKGGQVANDTPIKAGFDPNDFDDLALRDELTSSYGKDDNSGDNLGNTQEEEDRHDMVKRIMRQRSMKQHNPRPA